MLQFINVVDIIDADFEFDEAAFEVQRQKIDSDEGYWGEVHRKHRHEDYYTIENVVYQCAKCDYSTGQKKIDWTAHLSLPKD